MNVRYIRNGYARLLGGIRRRSVRLTQKVLYFTAKCVLVNFGRRKQNPRICIWATSLQTEILALTHALADTGQVELLVVTPNPQVFLHEPIQQVKPLSCPILDRNHLTTIFTARRFEADLVIIDDLLPDLPVASRLLYLWHGLGMWKVKPRGEIETFAERAKPHAGDVTKANSRFIAQCYGDTTRQWWTQEWGFAPECCKKMGMPFSDWILDPPYARDDARRSIGLPETCGPTILLSLSWHYGDRFGAWKDLTDLVSLVIKSIAPRNGHILLCLHNRGHYERTALERLYTLVQNETCVYLRHKDEHPDNLADLQAADIMISNYSSFLGYFYVTGKPSIHLDPRGEDRSMPKIASYASGSRRMHDVCDDDVWLNTYENHGGIVVKNPRELMRAIERALANPHCCREQSRRFLEEHVVGMDGRTSHRMAQEILEWLRSGYEMGK